jgi:putative PIN family toxin of toxin-antitoxin system
VGNTIKKITVDTNILISAFVYPGGVVREIINLSLKKYFEIFISGKILEEYSRVLRLKFNWSDAEINGNINFLKKIASVVEPDLMIKAVREDPTDNIILECAVFSGSDVIVSGDKHLLNLKKYKTIPIIPPAELLKLTRK